MSLHRSCWFLNFHRHVLNDSTLFIRNRYSGIDTPIIYERINDRWEVGMTISKDAFQQVRLTRCTPLTLSRQSDASGHIPDPHIIPSIHPPAPR